MTTDITDPIETLKGIIEDNWDTGNCSTPTIRAMKDVDYGKLHNYIHDGDGVLIYAMKTSEKPISLGYANVDVMTPLAVDFGTENSKTQFLKILNEIRRILHTKRKTPGSNWDTLTLEGWNDLSDKYQRFWRGVIDVQLYRWGETV